MSSYADYMLVDLARPGVVYLSKSGTLGGFGFLGTVPASGGNLYRSDDFGRTWSTVYTTDTAHTIRPFATDPLNADGIYASHTQEVDGHCLIHYCRDVITLGTTRSINAGSDWSAPLAAPGNYAPAGPTPSAPTRLFVSAFSGDTFATVSSYVSFDSGGSWSRFDAALPWPLTWVVPDPQLASVLYAFPQIPNRFLTLRSDDGGASWKEIFNSYTTQPVLTIDPARPNVVWLSYSNETMFRSEDRGNTWREVQYPFTLASTSGTVTTSPAEPGVVYVVRSSRLFRGVPALAPDPIVVEFGYEGSRYWLTSLDGEALSQDYRQQPGDVRRTGLRWGAWRRDDAPPGAVGSCRFWPRPETGLRTRVLVQQGFECEALKRNSGWILEAENEFYTAVAANDSCPPGTVPVRRFNNLQPDLNHRWVANEVTAALMRASGWYDEGVRFCGRSLGANE
jgi:hypothetical protein